MNDTDLSLDTDLGLSEACREKATHAVTRCRRAGDDCSRAMVVEAIDALHTWNEAMDGLVPEYDPRTMSAEARRAIEVRHELQSAGAALYVDQAESLFQVLRNRFLRNEADSHVPTAPE